MAKFKVTVDEIGEYVSYQITGSHYYVDNNRGTLSIFESTSGPEVAAFANGAWVSVIKEAGE